MTGGPTCSFCRGSHKLCSRSCRQKDSGWQNAEKIMPPIRFQGDENIVRWLGLLRVDSLVSWLLRGKSCSRGRGCGLYMFNMVSLSVWAAVTIPQTGWLISSNYFSQFRWSGSPKSWGWQTQCLERASFLVHSQDLLAVSSHGGRSEGAVWGLFYEGIHEGSTPMTSKYHHIGG